MARNEATDTIKRRASPIFALFNPLFDISCNDHKCNRLGIARILNYQVCIADAGATRFDLHAHVSWGCRRTAVYWQDHVDLAD